VSDLIKRLRDAVLPIQKAWPLQLEAAAKLERLTDELINTELLAKDRYCKMQTEIERKDAEIAELKEVVEDYKQKQVNMEAVVNANIESGKRIRAENEKLRAALDKLARLGNEPEYGNSDGNRIALAALEDEE